MRVLFGKKKGGGGGSGVGGGSGSGSSSNTGSKSNGTAGSLGGRSRGNTAKGAAAGGTGKGGGHGGAGDGGRALPSSPVTAVNGSGGGGSYGAQAAAMGGDPLAPTGSSASPSAAAAASESAVVGDLATLAMDENSAANVGADGPDSLEAAAVPSVSSSPGGDNGSGGGRNQKRRGSAASMTSIPEAKSIDDVDVDGDASAAAPSEKTSAPGSPPRGRSGGGGGGGGGGVGSGGGSNNGGKGGHVDLGSKSRLHFSGSSLSLGSASGREKGSGVAAGQSFLNLPRANASSKTALTDATEMLSNRSTDSSTARTTTTTTTTTMTNNASASVPTSNGALVRGPVTSVSDAPLGCGGSSQSPMIGNGSEGAAPRKSILATKGPRRRNPGPINIDALQEMEDDQIDNDDGGGDVIDDADADADAEKGDNEAEVDATAVGTGENKERREGVSSSPPPMSHHDGGESVATGGGGSVYTTGGGSVHTAETGASNRGGSAARKGAARTRAAAAAAAVATATAVATVVKPLAPPEADERRKQRRDSITKKKFVVPLPASVEGAEGSPMVGGGGKGGGGGGWRKDPVEEGERLLREMRAAARGGGGNAAPGTGAGGRPGKGFSALGFPDDPLPSPPPPPTAATTSTSAPIELRKRRPKSAGRPFDPAENLSDRASYSSRQGLRIDRRAASTGRFSPRSSRDLRSERRLSKLHPLNPNTHPPSSQARERPKTLREASAHRMGGGGEGPTPSADRSVVRPVSQSRRRPRGETAITVGRMYDAPAAAEVSVAVTDAAPHRINDQHRKAASEIEADVHRQVKRELKESVRKSKLDKITELQAEARDLRAANGDLRREVRERERRMSEMEERISELERSRALTKAMGRAAVPARADGVDDGGGGGAGGGESLASASEGDDAARVEAVRALSEAAYQNKVSLSVQRQKLARAERELDEAQARYDELKSKATADEIERMNLGSENDALKLEMERLREELHRAVAAADRAQSGSQTASEASGQSADAIKAIQLGRRLVEAERRNHALEQEVSLNEGRVAKLADDLTLREEEVEETRRELEAQIARAVGLEMQVVELQKRSSRQGGDASPQSVASAGGSPAAMLALERARAEAADARADSDMVRSLLREAKEEMSVLRSESVRMAADADRAMRDLEDARAETAAAQAERERVLSEADRAMSELAEARIEAEAVREAMERTKAELAEARDEMGRIRNEREEANRRHEEQVLALAAKATASTEAEAAAQGRVPVGAAAKEAVRVIELETELRNVRSELDDRTEEAKALRAALDSAKVELMEVRDEAEKARSEVKEARSEVKEARSEAEEARSEAAQVRSELDLQSETLATLKKGFEAKDELNEELRGELSRIGDELRSVQKEKTDADKEHETELRRSREEAERRHEREFKFESDERERVRSLLAQAEEELEVLRQERTQANERHMRELQSVREVVSSRSVDEQYVDSDVQALQETLDQANADLESLRSLLSARDREIARLKSNAESKKEELNRVWDRVDRLDEDKRNLANELQALERQLREEAENANDVIEAKWTELERKNKRIEFLGTEIQRLEGELTGAKARVDTLENENRNLKTAVAAAGGNYPAMTPSTRRVSMMRGASTRDSSPIIIRAATSAASQSADDGDVSLTAGSLAVSTSDNTSEQRMTLESAAATGGVVSQMDLIAAAAASKEQKSNHHLSMRVNSFSWFLPGNSSNDDKEQDQRTKHLERELEKSRVTIEKLKSDLVRVRTAYKEEEYKARKKVEKLEEENRSFRLRIDAFERQFAELNERMAAADGLAGLGGSIELAGIGVGASPSIGSTSGDDDVEISSQVHSEITMENLDDPSSGAIGSTDDAVGHTAAAESRVSRSNIQLDAAFVTQLRDQVFRSKAIIEKLDERLADQKKASEETEQLLRDNMKALKKEHGGLRARLSAELNLELDELRTRLKCREATISSLEIAKENAIIQLEEKIAILENRGQGLAEKSMEAGLDRVDLIQKHTNSTIEVISSLLTRLQKAEHNEEGLEVFVAGINMATDLAEKALLVEREAEVSLQLIELRLKNKIEALKLFPDGDGEIGKTAANGNEKPFAGVMDSTNIQRMAAITALERETMSSIRGTQADFVQQMERLRGDLGRLKSATEAREENIRSLEEKARRGFEAQDASELLRSEVELSAERLKDKEKTIQELMALVDKYKEKNEECRKRYEKTKRKVRSLEEDMKSALERIEEKDLTIRSLRSDLD